MDSDQTVNELRSDLKNAREFMSSLMENYKTLKLGKDEELHRKMDEILNQKDDQKELEKKIDRLQEELIASREEIKSLKEEVRNVAEEVRNSEEMKRIIDSVETSVGYQELFVKDFEKIHAKIQEMEVGVSSKLAATCVKFEELTTELLEQAKKTENLRTIFENFGGKMENIERKLDGIAENEQNLANLVGKVEKLEQGLTGKMDLISNNIMEMMKTMEKEINYLKVDSGDFKEEIVEKLAEIKTCTSKTQEKLNTFSTKTANVGQEVANNLKEQVKSENSTVKSGFHNQLANQQLNMRCFHKYCKLRLPNNLRRDGVSVECKCKNVNIVGTLKEGHTWVVAYCDQTHFQQAPIKAKHGETAKCQVCGKFVKTYEASYHKAIPG